MCFASITDLPHRLHREAMSRNHLLWTSVALLSLHDMSHFTFFPWINNPFCERSDGLPTFKLFVLVHTVSLLQNIIITVALATTKHLKLLQFLSLFSSLLLILISMYMLCIKRPQDKINVHDVIVASRRFTERAESVGISLNNVMRVDPKFEAPPEDIEAVSEVE
jgi:hypothetical protein